MIAVVLGGIGIFLIGMILLTDGLKAAAGDALRGAIERFARTPFTALLSGAGVTALVQSSSATTLTTIGFVSAGLLTFPQALGVVFGANLGTTSTGWIVSVLGLKVSIGAVALPLVGAGALVRLLGRGRWQHVGLAVAGFGLIFVGIDALQAGMEGLAERLDPGALRARGVLGGALLVAVGVAMTVVLQSSSAAVATTLTALHAGTIGLEQAALLVIGQNVGTTVKAALAAIGGSIPVRRTALAHILFNLFTGGLALLLLPVLLAGATAVVGPEDPAVVIALFHTSFNLLGVVVLFPVIRPFSRWVERMVPEGPRTLTGHLDRSVAEVPAVGVEAARRSALATAGVLLVRAAHEADPGGGRGPASPPNGEDPEEALRRIRTFLSGMRTPTGSAPEFARHLSLVHAVDHLDRFRARLAERGWIDPELAPSLAGSWREWAEGTDPETGTTPGADGLAGRSRWMAEQRKLRRATLLAEVAEGRRETGEARTRVEGILRLDRLAYHAWRMAEHLGAAAPFGSPAGAEDPLLPGVGEDLGEPGGS